MLKVLFLASICLVAGLLADDGKEEAYRKFIGEKTYSIPFKTRVSEPLKNGHTIHVIGTINEAPKRVDFNFHKGAADDADMPLHLSIRFDEGFFHSKIVYNIFENGNWSDTEQRISNPFKANTTFDLRVRLSGNKYQIFTNRKEIGAFNIRTNIEGIDYVSITGDLKELKLFKYGGAEFDVPYTALAAVVPGKRLDVSAMPKGKRVDVQLQRKNGDIPLQISIRYNEGAIVRNSQTGEVWDKEEREGKFPLNKNEIFDLTIINEPYSYQIFFNNKRFATYAHRGSAEDIHTVSITGDVALQTVTVNSVL
uniref:Galectin n=1 Tax=Rhabditophanes sp. KR3021 TaxID=114890 RepID=A0AC35U4E5_9BILA